MFPAVLEKPQRKIIYAGSGADKRSMNETTL